jgi:AhpD family alkylhydroperoxidase
MEKSTIEKFTQERDRLNNIMSNYTSLSTKRFLSLDNQMYRQGALPENTKELLGLVASLVLRCDDCINYHLKNCFDLGYSDQEIEEALSIGLLVGGSIVIPHMRRAIAVLDEMRKNEKE